MSSSPAASTTRTIALSSSATLRRPIARLALLSVWIAVVVLAMVVSLLAGPVQAQSSSAPVGPLTTNNAQSACVQYGDCTTLPSGNTVATISQLSAVTSPSTTTPAYAAPTNSAETEASLSLLASSGASAAYSTTATGSPASVDYTSTSPLTGAVQATTINYSSSSNSSSTAQDSAARRMAQTSGIGSWLGALGLVTALVVGLGSVLLA